MFSSKLGQSKSSLSAPISVSWQSSAIPGGSGTSGRRAGSHMNTTARTVAVDARGDPGEQVGAKVVSANSTRSSAWPMM